MFGDLFYFIGLIISFVNLGLIPSLNSILRTEEWVSSFQKINGRFPSKLDFKEVEQLKKMNVFYYYTVSSTLWMVIGLVSKSWFVFLSLLFINFLVMRILNKIGIHKSISKYTRIFLVTFNTILTFLLVLNHFHFHFQLLEFFYK